jgi:hypothetical protein
MELMTMKVTPSIVPDATCFNPVLPIDGIIVGHIWAGVMEGVVPTHAHFMYDEKGREGCMLIRYVEGNSFAMVRLNIIIVMIRIINQYEFLCLSCVNNWHKAKKNSNSHQGRNE